MTKAVLFDLDGTLLDTANDLVCALNIITDTQINMSPELRAAAGRGFKGLLKTGLNIEDSHELYDNFFQQFQTHYELCLLNSTDLFLGMQEVLQTLEEKNILWGIVTNKPTRFTEKIIAGLDSMANAKCVISGDTYSNRKPHPEPLEKACELIQIPTSECIFVGDSEIDVLAAKAAGLKSLVALYGYIAAQENPLSWQADGYIERPEEILEWI